MMMFYRMWVFGEISCVALQLRLRITQLAMPLYVTTVVRKKICSRRMSSIQYVTSARNKSVNKFLDAGRRTFSNQNRRYY